MDTLLMNPLAYVLKHAQLQLSNMEIFLPTIVLTSVPWCQISMGKTSTMATEHVYQHVKLAILQTQ